MDNFALGISFVSLIVAAIALGWNIYRDIVLKAKIVVTCGVRLLVDRGTENHPEYVVISATNHGPGVVNLRMLQLQETSFIKKITRNSKHAVLMHDYENLMSGQLPNKLEVGDTLDLLLPYDENCFLKEPFTHVGISDTYGRINWAKSKQVKIARQQWLDKYGEST
ncbi:hypothetical protein ACJO1Y_23575 [Vibrio parahaemolyticus]|uniref:hypothetical protein n=1 Tax=Vibrio parahaemolyticus TaxID=670 RepID=UPI000472F2AA|nr:hypothetical protein [Vibrio parahaemolyticus]HCE4766042.1 hypothetical protein [Vibrio parahaemolyticus]HCG8346975.1 hypothetical protein [Vibrio parahaemolyticus]HCG9725016.1 hypothetical protein [Vibrio parahaemolyticus]HCH1655509.1 hypothetical protein [Vibrio parahaemolyticus]HCH3204579.1 hypothetical protein [Vibrio parahaemolyticus]